MPEVERSLTINEIYHSIQGESTWAGRPCVFVRLTFCDLRCNYCDTEYAFYEGKKKTLREIVDTVAAFCCPLVEVTGGEPLLQKNVLPLMSMLCDTKFTVLLETSGAHDISEVDPRVHRIMDLKTPGSGEAEKNLWSNIDHLTVRDEVKFVMDRAKTTNGLAIRCNTMICCPVVMPCCSHRFSDESIRARSSSGFCPIDWMSAFKFRCTSSSGIRRSAECERGGQTTRHPE